MNYKLRDIQTWAMGLITDNPQLLSDEKRTLFAQPQWQVENLITPSPNLNSHQRLAIYKSSYFLRLLECFKHDYKHLYQSIGDDLFNNFVWHFLEKNPPSSYTLTDLGKHFPNYLISTLDQNSVNGAIEPWQLYIIELATYERLLLEVYLGEGHETCCSIDPFPLTEVKISPALKILKTNFNFNFILRQSNPTVIQALPEPQHCYFGITRDNFTVQIHELEVEEFNYLKHAIENSSLQDVPTGYVSAWIRKRFVYHTP